MKVLHSRLIDPEDIARRIINENAPLLCKLMRGIPRTAAKVS